MAERATVILMKVGRDRRARRSGGVYRPMFAAGPAVPPYPHSHHGRAF